MGSPRSRGGGARRGPGLPSCSSGAAAQSAALRRLPGNGGTSRPGGPRQPCAWCWAQERETRLGEPRGQRPAPRPGVSRALPRLAGVPLLPEPLGTCGITTLEAPSSAGPRRNGLSVPRPVWCPSETPPAPSCGPSRSPEEVDGLGIIAG